MQRLTQCAPTCEPARCLASRADVAAAKPVPIESTDHVHRLLCCAPCSCALQEALRPAYGSQGMLRVAGPGQQAGSRQGSGQGSRHAASAARHFRASITTTACQALSRQPRRLGKDTEELGVARGGRPWSRARGKEEGRLRHPTDLR